MEINEKIAKQVADTLVKAGSTFLPDKKEAYKKAIETETNAHAKWVLETILKNAEVAQQNHSPLCDDTGIVHMVLEVGENHAITGNMIRSIEQGVIDGLRKLPGRPMAVKGDDWQRIDMSLGMDEDPAALKPAPLLVRYCKEDVCRLHVMMFGGGPAIRGKTYRVFHKHDTNVVLNEIISWAKESTKMLGCTPCTLAVGVGRSQFEATSLMMQALVDGDYSKQSEMEKIITEGVNEAAVGPLGLGGNHTVLATFMKVGPQRASGVRVVCLRPCCCFEPRIATINLEY